MTIDDVVVRTVTLLGMTGITGVASWIFLTNDNPLTFPLMMGSLVIALILGLVISFKQVTNPVVIGAYAVLQGVLLGVISRVFESAYGGIVLQAVAATFAVFVGMGVLYKFKVLRVTPKFTKVVIGATIGLFALMMINLVVGFFNSGSGIGIRGGLTGSVGWLPIVFSLVAIVVAALNFVLDFDQVEQGIRYGLPEKYAWACAFGILVGLIWLYLEMLRLLSYLRR